MSHHLVIDRLTVHVDDCPVLNDISFEAHCGETSLIEGPNGAGKSSLFFALMGHPKYRVARGSIIFAGKDITHMPADERARQGIFLAFQQPPACPGLSVSTFMREAYRAVTGSVAPMAHIQDAINETLNAVGLSADYAERSVHESFSGGEKKRLELAQILLCTPRLVLLDELDTGLDRNGQELVVKALHTLRKKMPDSSIICISHSSLMARTVQPDHRYVMQNGHLTKKSVRIGQTQSNGVFSD